MESQIEELCKCAICLECISCPITLSCGHNYCLGCITAHIKTKLFCPQCKTPVSYGGVQTNTLLEFLIARLCVVEKYADEKELYDLKKRLDAISTPSAKRASFTFGIQFATGGGLTAQQLGRELTTYGFISVFFISMCFGVRAASLLPFITFLSMLCSEGLIRICGTHFWIPVAICISIAGILDFVDFVIFGLWISIRAIFRSLHLVNMFWDHAAAVTRQ